MSDQYNKFNKLYCIAVSPHAITRFGFLICKLPLPATQRGR